jgi:hypothetical protein
MLKALRSRRFALATLAAFLLAQPAAACAALCLFDGHHAPAHATPSRGNAAHAAGTCHATTAVAVQRDPFQDLSPMAPARPAAIAVAGVRWIEPVRTLPAPPRLLAHLVEPPPPRFV